MAPPRPPNLSEIAASLLTLCLTLTACSRDFPDSGKDTVGSSTGRGFVDTAVSAGLTFRHENGAQGRRFLPETTVGGAGWIDYDGDGYFDLYVVNGNENPDSGDVGSVQNRLFRNLGDGSFIDVTDKAGVGHRGYGAGVAVGDFDNDGRSDLYVTNVGKNVLYRNQGKGRFRDVTERAGVECPEWSSSATFVDIDADGFLDLYVCNYVVYQSSVDCRTREIPTYCSPKEFSGAPDRLFRNLGGGRFEDISDRAGVAIAGPDEGKSLGIIALDYDDDGDQDLYVACDQVPNLLFRNDGRGRFDEVGLESDSAYSVAGASQAGMGVDAGDIDLDGRFDIVVTNFSDENNAYYHNEGDGLFREISESSGLGGPTLPKLGFGVLLIDSDLDGDLDIYVANGHVLDNAAKLRDGQKFAQNDQLLENIDGRRFVDISSRSGSWFRTPTVSRAAASADMDNDGDEDIVVVSSSGPLALLRNDRPTSPNAHWVALRLIGQRSNRDGYGARIHVTFEQQGRTLRRAFECRSGRSYTSACDPRVRVGLGTGSVSDLLVEIWWPSGSYQLLRDLSLDRVHDVVEADSGGAVPERSMAARGPAEATRAPTSNTAEVSSPVSTARTAHPTTVDFTALLAEVNTLASSHRVTAALDLIENRAANLRLDAKWSDAEVGLRERQALLLLTASRPHDAVAILDALVARRPERTAARIARARARLASGDPPGAVRELESLDISVRIAELQTYGRALLASGRAEEGLAAATAKLILDPWYEEAYLDLARALRRSGRAEVAAPFFTRHRAAEAWRRAEQDSLSFEYAGETAKALQRRAQAEEERGRLFRAMRLYQAAIKVQAGSGTAYLGLARLSIFLCQPDDAVTVLEAVKRRAGPNTSLLEVLSRSYEANGDVEAAKAGYRELLGVNASLDHVRDRLRRLERGKPPQALDNPEPERLRRLRETVRVAVKDMQISRSARELVRLVDSQMEHKRRTDARRLSLFIVHASPEYRDGLDSALRAWNRPQDVFVRLWLLRRIGGKAFAERLEGELADLGSDPGTVRSFLAR